MNLDDTLHRLATDPFSPVDLAELALRLARDEYPDLDVPTYLERLDDFAGELGRRVKAANSLGAQVMELGHGLFVEQGFEGNLGSYYDPKNSYLNEVLDRRLGIPITLSILAIAVGQRCGLNVCGIALPGHFVAMAIEGDERQVFDPFNAGQLLDEAGCEQLVSSVTGQPFTVTTGVLVATPPGLIAQRMLNNLKMIYLRNSDYARAARVIRRLTQLTPEDATQWRDLGVTLIHAGQPGMAIDHLHRYLRVSPNAVDGDAVRKFMREARKEVARYN